MIIMMMEMMVMISEAIGREIDENDNLALLKESSVGSLGVLA